MLKGGKPVHAIKALNNCYKTMLATKDPKSFDAVLKMFREEKSFLSHTMLLKSVAVLPANERATTEVITTIFHMLVNSPKSAMNLEYARSIIKNDEFITWVARILAK
jgi:predicted nucleic-acid-binding protein